MSVRVSGPKPRTRGLRRDRFGRFARGLLEALGEGEAELSVALVDDEGDMVPLSGVEIRLELIRERGDRSDELEGTTTQLTVDGVAAFPDLRVDRDDHDYRLRATAPGRPELGSVDSETFDIEH